MKSTFTIFVTLLLTTLCGLKLSAQKTGAVPESGQYTDFRAAFMWEARVSVGEAISVGKSKHGIRRVIPITGGTFSGPNIKGEVLPGGEDWQLVRPDGDTELNARYLLKTDDGYTIQVINRALIHVDANDQSFYGKSVADFEAPAESPYDYLNHALFLGTLTVPTLAPGEEPYVIIGVYRLL